MRFPDLAVVESLESVDSLAQFDKDNLRLGLRGWEALSKRRPGISRETPLFAKL